MNLRDRQRLQDIIKAIASIQRHQPSAQDGFLRNEPLQSHYKLNLQVIGEAASRLDPVVWSRAPSVPWRKIVGMRNILVHDYAGVDLDIVWRTVRDELPNLKEQVEKILTDPQHPAGDERQGGGRVREPSAGYRPATLLLSNSPIFAPTPP